MNEPTTSSDRRSRRSAVPAQATRLYLEHLAQRLGYEAIALATEEGLLVGVGEGYDLSLLSTLASLGSQIGSYEPDARHTDGEGALRFYGFELGERTVYVASVGGAPLPLPECAAALRRIHAVHVAPA